MMISTCVCLLPRFGGMLLFLWVGACVRVCGEEEEELGMVEALEEDRGAEREMEARGRKEGQG